jgi:hypothetical protein
MSAFGTKQTFRRAQSLSAFGVKRTWIKGVAMTPSDPKRTLYNSALLQFASFNKYDPRRRLEMVLLVGDGEAT